MMYYTPAVKKKKRPAPAGPKQNTRKPRKSTGGSNPLNRPAPNPTGGVAGGPSAPTRRSKPAGGYAKNKAKPAGYAKSPTKAKPRPGTRPGAKPPTAAQKKYAQQQTAKSALRAQGAKVKASLKGFPKVSKPKPGSEADKRMKAKAQYYKRLGEKAKAGKPASSKKQPVLKGLPKLGKMKPGTGTAPAKRKSPFAKGRPTRGRPNYTIMPAPGRPARKAPKYTTMPAPGAPKRLGGRPTPVKVAPKRPGGIAMSEAQRKAVAFQKVADAKKAARLKRTGKTLTAAQALARKKAASRNRIPIRVEKELAGKKAASRNRIPRRVEKEAAARAGAKRKRRAVVSRRPVVSPRRRPTGGPRRPGMGRRR